MGACCGKKKEQKPPDPAPEGASLTAAVSEPGTPKKASPVTTPGPPLEEPLLEPEDDEADQDEQYTEYEKEKAEEELEKVGVYESGCYFNHDLWLQFTPIPKD